jgi:hypothetical protein
MGEKIYSDSGYTESNVKIKDLNLFSRGRTGGYGKKNSQTRKAGP